MPHTPEPTNDRDDLDLLAAAEICDRFGIARRTLQTWRQIGKFPSPDLAIGKTIRWRRSTVENWLTENGNSNGRRRRA